MILIIDCGCKADPRQQGHTLHLLAVLVGLSFVCLASLV